MLPNPSRQPGFFPAGSQCGSTQDDPLGGANTRRICRRSRSGRLARHSTTWLTTFASVCIVLNRLSGIGWSRDQLQHGHAGFGGLPPIGTARPARQRGTLPLRVRSADRFAGGNRVACRSPSSGLRPLEGKWAFLRQGDAFRCDDCRSLPQRSAVCNLAKSAVLSQLNSSNVVNHF